MPAYDKWYDGFAEQWGAKNGVKVTIDHVPHLQIPAKIAAEIATQSGHDIVQLVGTGTEKWGAALLDVQDLADKLGKKYGGWTSLAENYAQGLRRQVPLDPRLLHRLPRALSQGPVDGGRHAQRAGHVGGPAQGRDEAQGQGLPHRDRPRPPRRLARVLASHHVVVRRLRDRQGRQDDHVQLQGSPRGAQVQQGAVQGRDDPRGARVGRRVEQPIPRLRPRLVDPQSDQRVPHHRDAEQGARRQDLGAALAARARSPGGRSPTAAPTASPSSRRTPTARRPSSRP